MDNDGGLAAHEAQQAEREADHETRQARMARLNPTETPEETVEEEPKPKRAPRSKKTAAKKS
jgi:hypothetical protein